MVYGFFTFFQTHTQILHQNIIIMRTRNQGEVNITITIEEISIEEAASIGVGEGQVTHQTTSHLQDTITIINHKETRDTSKG